MGDDGWVPVGERSPDDGVLVLTCNASSDWPITPDDYTLARRDSSCAGEPWGEWEEPNECLDVEVTHWRPLPAPPEVPEPGVLWLVLRSDGGVVAHRRLESAADQLRDELQAEADAWWAQKPPDAIPLLDADVDAVVTAALNWPKTRPHHCHDDRPTRFWVERLAVDVDDDE